MLFAIAHGGGAFEILFFDRLFFAQLDLFDLSFDLLELGRASHRANARTRTRFVHEVDGFVRQKPIGDVAVGKLHRRVKRHIGDLSFVMLFVLRTKALQDQNGFLNGRRFNLHGLEASFERSVLLDVFAIFVERRRANALHLTAAQGRLNDIRGVHRAFGRTGADDGVQLIDKQNDVLGAANLVHHGFDALLELATVFCAGDHQRKIKRDDAFLAKQFGNVAFGNFLRKTFDDCSLADTGFAQQHRIVLGAAAKDLNDPLDLVLAADHRVHFAFASDLSEVAAESFQRRSLHFALTFGGGFLGRLFGRLLFLRREIRVQFFQNLLARLLDIDIQVLEHARGDPIAFAQQAQKNVFGADVRVIQRASFLRGERENFFNARRVRNVADDALVGAGADLFLDFKADGFKVQPHLLKDVHRDALAELDQAKEKVFGADEVVVEPVGLLARQSQHLLRPRRKIVHGVIAHNA